MKWENVEKNNDDGETCSLHAKCKASLEESSDSDTYESDDEF